jgi:cation-transporting ATPase 13A1
MDFQRQRYFFDADALPLPRFACAQAPTSLPMSRYVSTRGFNSAEEVAQGTEVWGKNHISVQVPTFLQLLRLQLLSPIATFQFFVAFLWLLDEYWTYTMWNIVTVIMLESSTVWQRSRTQSMLGGMAPAPTVVHVFRCGRWDTVISHDILPGDIISISPKRSAAVGPAPNNSAEDIIPCDCLLLRGSAVINEASLTGESVPQMKEAVSASDATSSEELEMQVISLQQYMYIALCARIRAFYVFAGQAPRSRPLLRHVTRHPQRDQRWRCYSSYSTSTQQRLCRLRFANRILL